MIFSHRSRAFHYIGLTIQIQSSEQLRIILRIMWTNKENDSPIWWLKHSSINTVDAIVDMTLPVTEHAMQLVPRSIPTGLGAQSRVFALHWVSEMGEVPRSFLGIHFQEI